MDLVDAVLKKYNEDPDQEFGHHAWMAAFHLSADQIPAFCKLMEGLLCGSMADAMYNPGGFVVHSTDFRSRLEFRRHYNQMYDCRSMELEVSRSQ